MRTPVLAALLLSISMSASAEGLYVGFGFGRASFEIDAFYTPPPPGSETNDTRGTGSKFLIGYEVAQNLAVEGGLLQVQGLAETLNADSMFLTGQGKYEGNVRAFFLDAVIKSPQVGPIAFLGKFGVARTKTELTGSQSGALLTLCCSDQSASETNARYGIGLDVGIWKYARIRFEWERTAGVWHGAKQDGRTGESDLDFIGLVLTVNVN
jgi:hypothetical protein